ncbi:MAG: hypothetical protein WC663_06155 [Patescibacteria group bacterium]|jgi:hypothetical protein
MSNREPEITLPVVIQRDFFTSLSDDQAIQILIPIIGEKEARAYVQKCRYFAIDHFNNYEGTIFWLVKAGYTLKQHASKLGPCYKNFDYLQTWNFNDEPTFDSLVFWVPRLVPDGIRKTANEQLNYLARLSKKYDLPADHLTDFGSVTLNSGLILSYFNQTKERVPPDRLWIRTSARGSDGSRFDLGDFDERGLYCSGYDLGGGFVDDLGCFALGIVKLAA